MDKLLHIPGKYMPEVNTQAYKLLSVLFDGLFHPKKELLSVLNDDPRSALQALRGARYGYWLIHNIGDKKGVYQLDSRHLSGDVDVDREVRAEAEIAFRKRSRSQAERESERLPEAVTAEEQAKSRAKDQSAPVNSPERT